MNKDGIKVLVIDDDEDDFIIARDLFSEVDRDGYIVDWAPSLKRGLEQLIQNKHDVYLIDFRLGGDSGLELLRQAQANGSNAPMILLTGQGEAETDTEAMRAGAEDFLVKGQITPAQLARSVRYAIERKRSEREIQKLAAFPRCNPNPVLEFSADGSMTYTNEAARLLAQTLNQESLATILPPNTAQTITECLKKNEGCTIQTSHVDRTFSWRFVPIPASKVVHAYATEITERLNLETQLRHSVKMEAVGQLAAGVAHDFNNILTVIQGHASLLLSNPKADGELQKPLQQICTASERASGLIRQLLVFSSKQVIQPRHLDLNDIVSNVAKMLQRLVGEHICLQCRATPNLPTIYADPGMMEQIVLNLAINARDAMPRGGLVTISTGVVRFDEMLVQHNPKARPGQFVCLSVADSGIGIDEKIIGRIFEPFFTTKEVGKGTGLGLATVYGIVKQHEGWIDVESRMGVGTTFRVHLPVETKPANAPVENLREQAVKRGAETILVVEDEPALRDLVCNILKIYGYNVLSAGSGPEAIQVWEKHKSSIQLLLTDMVMPEGMSGRELAEELLKRNPRLKVIYTSGYSPGMAGKDLALLEGFNFLPKPYPPQKLGQMVRECLDSSKVNEN